MSVRTQFWILIGSVFLTPVLVILTFLTFQLGSRFPSDASPVTATIQLRQAQLVSEWLEAGRPEPGPSEVPPKWIRLAVWKPGSDTPMYQNVDRPGLTTDQAQKEFDVVLSRFSIGAEYYRIGILTPPGSWQPGKIFVPPELIMLSIVSVVIAVICLWILLTLKQRLYTLRQATERIAEGDLDTPLPTQSQDDFGTLANSFNEMRERLKTAMEGRDRLIMSVSHDLKTPLASIKGYTDALRDGLATTPEEERRYLDIIADKSDLLEHRVQDLIDYVKLSGSQWRLKRRPIPLGSLLSDWYSQFEQELALSGHTVNRVNRLEYSDQAVADPALLQRALENLVSNARQYSPPNSTIHLVARAHYDQWIIEVGNEGNALADDEAKQLFEAFYRADKGRNQRGLGLGLTVVATVMELHGGQVAYRHEGGLNWFQLIWPRETA